MSRHRADIVTARALRHGLDRGQRPDTVVRELVELACADWRLLELALARVERGLAERSSRVGECARDVLKLALALVTANPRLVPVPATAGAAGSMAEEVTWAGPDD